MTMGTRAKLSAVEWDAFSRRSRRMIHWAQGETKRIKRAFWQRQRAAERTEMPRKLADANNQTPTPITPKEP